MNTSDDGPHEGIDLIKLEDQVCSCFGSIAVLTDRELADLSQNLPGDPNTHPWIWSESWTRRWLYEDRLPELLKSCLASRGWSSTFQKCFDQLEELLRRPAPDSEPRHHEELRTPEGLDDAEKAVWERLRARLTDFIECDGVLALVPPDGGNEDDGVAMPFFLTEDGQFRHASPRGKDQVLQEWTQLLRGLQHNYELPLGVRVPVEFPSNSLPEGGSFGLPLILARERLSAERVPEFRPLDVLATGAINDKKVEGIIIGLPAKRKLSERLGCRLFVAPRTVNSPTTLAVEVGTSLEQVINEFSRVAPASHDFYRASLNVANIKRKLETAGGDENRPLWFWEETERRLRWCDKVIAEAVAQTSDVGYDCYDLMHDVQRRMGVPGFEELRSTTQEILSDYRQRTLYGRDPLTRQLDGFLYNQSGGLLLVTGMSGYGKTALLAHWLSKPKRGVAVFHHFFRAKEPVTRNMLQFFRHLVVFLHRATGSSLPRELKHLSLEDLRDEVVDAMELCARPGKSAQSRILLVLDGLDEAGDPFFEPPLSRKGLAAIHVVASARTGESGAPPGLRKWGELQSAALAVDHLDDTAIRNWFANDATAELQALAHEPRFVQLVFKKSKGSPAYLEWLLPELRKPYEEPETLPEGRRTWQQILTNAPPGYENLLREQFEISCQLASEKHSGDGKLLENLAALLVAAKEPLAVTDLDTLANSDPRLAVDLYAIPPQAHRWLSIIPGRGGKSKKLALANPQVKEVLRLVIPDADARFTKALLELCVEWKTNRSHYALRHLTAHLSDEGRWGDVADTLGQEAYSAQLQREFPDETTLPLELAQGALREAVRGEDATGISELMLAHAGLVARLSHPRSEDVAHLPRLEQAKHFANVLRDLDPAAATMWKLLAVLEHHQNGKAEAADELLAEILAGDRVMLVGAWADLAAALFARLLPAKNPQLAALARLLLDEEAKRDLVERIASKRQPRGFLTAKEIARTIRDKHLIHRARSSVLRAMAVCAEWAEVFGEVDLIPDPELQGLLLIELAKYASEERRHIGALREIVARLGQLADEAKLTVQPSAKGLSDNGGAASLHSAGQPPRPVGLAWLLQSLHAQSKAWLGAALLRHSGADEATVWFKEAKGFAYSYNRIPAGFSTFLSFAESQAFLVGKRPPRWAVTKPADSVVEALDAAEASWQEMYDNPNNSNNKLLHEYLNLLRAAGALLQSLPILEGRFQRWLQTFQTSERHQYLSQNDADEIRARYVELLCGLPNADSKEICRQLSQIKDRIKWARALRKLILRLNKDSVSADLDSLHPKPGLKHALRTAGQAYLAALHLDNGDLTEAIQCWDNSLRSHSAKRSSPEDINLAVALAEVGRAASSDAPDLSRRFLEAALARVQSFRPPGHMDLQLRFLADVAELAHSAGYYKCRDSALDEARCIAEGLARASTRADQPVEGVEIIAAWCVLAELEEMVERRAGDNRLTRAYQIADNWTGFPKKTEAFVEIAEARMKLGDEIGANKAFENMERFIRRDLPALRGRGAKRDIVRCLVELVLGLVKAGNYRWAQEIYNEERSKPDKEQLAFFKDDEGRRALAVAYAAWRPVGMSPKEAVAASKAQVEDIRDPEVKARALRDIAIAHARGNRPWLVFRAVGEIMHGQDRGDVLHRVAKEFVRQNAAGPFKRLLAPCAWSYGEVYLMLGHMVRLWPHKARQVAAVLERHGCVRE
jgi:hypothetical protein